MTPQNNVDHPTGVYKGRRVAPQVLISVKMLVELSGKTLNVWTSGKSADGQLGKELVDGVETFIFIHGLGSSQNYYYPILSGIVPFGNCIIFDNEGAGNSPLSDTPPTVESMAGDVVRLLDHYKVASATVVGHSMGGMAALKAAELYSSRVNALILLGPVHPTEKGAQVMAGRIDTINQSGNLFQIADAVPQLAPAKSVPSLNRAFIRALIASQTPQGYAAACKVIVDAKPPSYAKVKAPVLLLVGDEDMTAPYDGCASVIEQDLQNVVVEKLDQVGHWYCIEAPEKILSPIVNWLKK